MTIKCKYADIKQIYDWYNRFADDKMAQMYNSQPSVYELAYYTPSQANWSYIIGLVTIDNVPYKVVTVFGQVKAVMPANIPAYTMDEIKDRIY